MATVRSPLQIFMGSVMDAALQYAADTPPAFTPLALPGLKLWLDASDPATIQGSSPMTGWLDKSPAGNNCTNPGVTDVSYIATAGSQAARGLTASLSLTSGITAGSEFHAWAVVTPNSIPSSYAGILGDTVDANISWDYSPGGLRLYKDALKLLQPSANAASPRNIGGLEWEAGYTNPRQSINGSIVGSTAPNPPAAPIVFTCLGYAVTLYGLNGDYHEIIVADGAVTADQSLQVITYLKAKWDIA